MPHRSGPESLAGLGLCRGGCPFEPDERLLEPLGRGIDRDGVTNGGCHGDRDGLAERSVVGDNPLDPDSSGGDGAGVFS